MQNADLLTPSAALERLDVPDGIDPAIAVVMKRVFLTNRSAKTMPRHCPGCSHPTICRTHGCAAVEYRRNKERKMEGPPKFNARSDAHKPRNEPGQGDDVPCVKCGGALDTGLECTECGHDNHEAVTGKPFGA